MQEIEKLRKFEDLNMMFRRLQAKYRVIINTQGKDDNYRYEKLKQCKELEESIFKLQTELGVAPNILRAF